MEYRNSCAWRIQTVINNYIKIQQLFFLSRANGIFLCIICFHKHFQLKFLFFNKLQYFVHQKDFIPFVFLFQDFPVPTFHNSTFPPCNICLVNFFLVNILSTFFLVNILSKMPHLFTIQFILTPHYQHFFLSFEHHFFYAIYASSIFLYSTFYFTSRSSVFFIWFIRQFFKTQHFFSSRKTELFALSC